MKKKILASVIFVALLASFANAAIYGIDISHSSTNFKIKHLGISNVNGNFKNFDGIIDIENNVPKKIDAIIKTNSVNTENKARDEHLKAVDFFDSNKYPDMKFVMTKFEKESDSTGKVTGNLTIRDITKSITLDYEFGGKSKNKDGVDIVGFTLEGKIKRSDFKFGSSFGTLTLGDEVKLSIEIEAVAK